MDLALAAESVDVRLAWLEGAYEQISERLGAVERRLATRETRFEGCLASREAKN